MEHSLKLTFSKSVRSSKIPIPILKMANIQKKMFSFRAEPKLLKALRERADAQGTNVSDVIITILSEALKVELDRTKTHTQSVDHEPRKPLMEEMKREMKREIKEELKEELKGNL